MWVQRVLELPVLERGSHLITQRIEKAIPELRQCPIGLLHLFLQHTSASLTINENADPDVRWDLEQSLNRMVPESQPFRHTVEGPDDMPAHIKSTLIGCELTVPVSQGRLALGTWQGIQLVEHRDHATPRRIVLTLHGQSIPPAPI